MKTQWFLASDHSGDLGAAKKAMLARRRVLRAAGYTATYQVWDFGDLARDLGYKLEYGKLEYEWVNEQQ